MPWLGAHMSIAGGIDRAPERGRQATCDVIQLFTKSNLQWAAAPIGNSQRKRFFANLERFGIRMAFAHACYLINLCSADPAIRRRSRRTLAIELARCSKLRLPHLVIHPGSHGGQGEREAMKQIVEGISWAFEKAGTRADAISPTLLLETTAGQGTSMGWRFEHLAALLDRLAPTNPVDICFDTCHVYASGYDLRTRETYERTIAEFDRVVGIRRLKVFHLNDSRGHLGSRLDRHEHIGQGQIGLAGFRLLLNDARFANRPMVIETPKGKTLEPDIANLNRLRSLIVPTSSTDPDCKSALEPRPPDGSFAK